jgi:hypothetical protein
MHQKHRQNLTEEQNIASNFRPKTDQKLKYLVKWNSSGVCNDESSNGAAYIVENLRSIVILGNDRGERLQKQWVVSANKFENIHSE